MSNDNAISPQAAELPNYILVVEDDIALRFTLAEWLRNLHYIVYEAANADEAATLLASPVTVDLVVTDVDMPGTMNGLALVDHIRQVAPAMKVIVVSGNAFHQEAKERRVLFFRKPYNFETIASFIGKLIQDNPMEDNNE